MLSEQKDIKLPDGLEDQIATWLCREIQSTRTARKELEEIWTEINKLYEATELKDKIDYPFIGAAHMMIPVLPMMVETAKSKIFTTIFSPRDPLTPVSLNPAFEPFEIPLRKFLTWAAKHELKLEDRLDPIVLVLLKMGTTIAKAVYTREYVNQRVWQPSELLDDGGEWVDEVHILRDSPEILHPRIEDIVFPLDTTDDTLNECPWISERFRVSRNKFKRWYRSRNFDDEKLELIRKWEDNAFPEVTEARMKPGEVPAESHQVELEEVWFDHAVEKDKDARLYRLCGYLHIPTKTFLKLSHGWFPHGLHPYEVCQLERREHLVYGNGFGQLGRVFQLEISTQHNQRIDAKTIANANVFKRKSDSMIPEDLVFRPGATIPVDDMDDLEALFTGQKYDSTIEDEKNSISLLKERVGIQEYAPDALAQAQSTTLALTLGESTRRFDQVVKRVRRFISRIMMKIMLLYQKYYPENKSIMIQGEEGGAMQMLTTQFPPEYIYNGMLIDVTATTSFTSAEMERQNKTTLFNLQGQTYGQITQYLTQAANPQLPIPVRLAMLAFCDGLLQYFGDVIEDYNLSNARELAGVGQQVAEQIELLRQQALAPQPGPGLGMDGPGGPVGAAVSQGAQGGA